MTTYKVDGDNLEKTDVTTITKQQLEEAKAKLQSGLNELKAEHSAESFMLNQKHTEKEKPFVDGIAAVNEDLARFI